MSRAGRQCSRRCNIADGQRLSCSCRRVAARHPPGTPALVLSRCAKGPTTTNNMDLRLIYRAGLCACGWEVQRRSATWGPYVDATTDENVLVSRPTAAACVTPAFCSRRAFH